MTIPNSRFEDKPDRYSESQPDKEEISMARFDFNWFYYLNRGMFWGIMVGTVAIASGGIGAALTTIPEVSESLAARLNQNKIATELIRRQTRAKIVPANLTEPINILVVGIQPNTLKSESLSDAVINKSSDILLWQLRPQQKLATVTTIPGNSRVFIPQLGWSTIEEVNTYGGVGLVSQAIEQLVEGVTVDRYITATPQALSALTAITGDLVTQCSTTMSERSLTNAVECTSELNKFQQQQTAIATLRQRLHDPEVASQISTSIPQLSRYLNTNLSQSEILSLADFIGKIPEKRLAVNLPGEIQQMRRFGSNSNLAPANFEHEPNLTKMRSPERVEGIAIAIQNTTNNPELALEAIAYLKQHNFQNVYLVNYLPLQLEETEIIIPQSKFKTADYIRQTLGLGKLQLAPDNSQKAILIRIGRDARYLGIDDSFIR
jgi:polyisoprenyl-teichoic acid--peptidoglycan teichoic acid transferase